MGYGDITSASDLERCFSIVGMIIGATVFGYIIGNVAAIMENFNVTDAIENGKMNQIKEWLYDRKVYQHIHNNTFGSTRVGLLQGSLTNERSTLRVRLESRILLKIGPTEGQQFLSELVCCSQRRCGRVRARTHLSLAVA